jgi:hypothetical protein
MADLVTLIFGAEPETALPAEIQTAITNLGNSVNALTAALADPNTEAAASTILVGEVQQGTATVWQRDYNVSLSSSWRRRPLKLSMKSFCCGLPGAM